MYEIASYSGALDTRPRQNQDSDLGAEYHDRALEEYIDMFAPRMKALGTAGGQAYTFEMARQSSF